MLSRIKVINRQNFAVIEQMNTRDIPVQVGSSLTVCALAYWMGHTGIAIFVAVWVICAEWSTINLFKKRAPFADLDKDQVLLIAFAIGAANAIIYLLPSLYLARDPSIAVKLMAVLWVLGVQVYITNTWSRVPIFLYTRLGPTLAILVLTIFQVSATPPVAATQFEWGIALLFVFVFIYVTVETLSHHMKTEWALVKAEAEASARATQLEDSQRLDILTGLLNRPAFDKALNAMLSDMPSEDGGIAVFMIDLDNFKPINDTYSHIAGDAVLEEIAARLKHVVGDYGIVGRMGGDEFICAICDVADADAALNSGRDFLQIISRGIEWNGHQLKVFGSVGIALAQPSDSVKPSTVSGLCSAADQAMFAAKNAPKSDPVLYSLDLLGSRLSALDKQALIEAVSDNRLRPYYQPKIDIKTGDIVGFEALARWHHPDGSVRNPDEFVEQISELGLRGDFMTSMAKQVVNDIQHMIDRGFNPGKMSFNVPEIALATVSGRRDLHKIITAAPQAAEHLTFEITEDVFIARAADSMQTSVAEFRDLGIRISLDDFGTGFASFHHLQKLEFDELKIDTSFVATLGQDHATDVLVRGFLDIATGLGVDVIAEGVETDEQRQTLMAMGCKTAQGYLFSPAVPIDQAIALLQGEHAA